MSLETWAKSQPSRCDHGYAPNQHPDACACDHGPSEWDIFREALARAVDPSGVVHQSAMRPLIRGRVTPKQIGSYYRRAKNEGLIRDTGDREPSNDVAGRNTDKLDRIYVLVGATEGRRAAA